MMAYELFFRATDGEISLVMFQNYFKKHPHYRVVGPEAIYENENTEARFVFRYMHMNGEGSRNVRPEGTYRISLSVDYCVPTFFIVEALYEVNTLIDETKVVIYDPQPDGVGTGLYNGEKMFESWMIQNESAIRQLAREESWKEDDQILVSYEWMQKLWDWNYGKPVMQERVGQSVYVPTARIYYDGKNTKVGIVWENGRPIAMPNVDLVTIARYRQGGGELEYCTVEYEAIEGFVRKYCSHTVGDAYVMSYDGVPEDIKIFIANAKHNDSFMKVSIDQILEDEVVEDSLYPNGKA